MNFNEELNSINDFVSYVKTCKEAMRQALISQEQDVPVEATLDTYADYIAAIEGGGGVTVYTVQYLDWDSAVLKSQQVLPGGDVLPPTSPARDEWVFTGWSGTSTNVQSDLIITAQYDYAPNTVYLLDYDLTLIEKVFVPTGSDYTPETPVREDLTFTGWSDPLTNIVGNRIAIARYTNTPATTASIYITLTEATGLNPTLYYTSIGSAPNILIDWGDGNTEIDNWNTMNANRSHLYAAFGSYKIEISGASSIGYGYAVGDYPKSALLSPYSLGVSKVFSGTPATKLTTNALKGFSNMTQVLLPEGLTTISSQTFYGCSSLEGLVLPSTITQFYNSGQFVGCTNLKKLVIMRDTPPTNGVVLNDLPPTCKLYVPDAAVATYQTEYSTYPYTIYPISQLANEY